MLNYQRVHAHMQRDRSDRYPLVNLLDFASFRSISASFVRSKIAHAEAIFLRDGLFLCYGRVPRSERWESMGTGSRYGGFCRKLHGFKEKM